MTVIVGVETDSGVIIGGDSAGTDPYSYASSIRRDVKVFENGAYLIGFTSSFRMGQLLHHVLEPPYPPADDDELEKFMVRDFIDGVRLCLKDGGYASIIRDDGYDGEEAGGYFLVGVLGKLFIVEEDYQVGRVACGYAAVGCGDDLALGSLTPRAT